MVEYVTLYNGSGEFIGYAVKKQGVDKLHSTNIYTAEEVRQQIATLNESELIKAHWPRLDDEEVLELVKNQEWEPLKLHEEEVIDEAQSNIVENVPGIVDWPSSTLVYAKIMVPDSIEAQNRTRKAMEIVARRRAGLDVESADVLS